MHNFADNATSFEISCHKFTRITFSAPISFSEVAEWSARAQLHVVVVNNIDINLLLGAFTILFFQCQYAISISRYIVSNCASSNFPHLQHNNRE